MKDVNEKGIIKVLKELNCLEIIKKLIRTLSVSAQKKEFRFLDDNKKGAHFVSTLRGE